MTDDKKPSPKPKASRNALQILPGKPLPNVPPAHAASVGSPPPREENILTAVQFMLPSGPGAHAGVSLKDGWVITLLGDRVRCEHLDRTAANFVVPLSNVAWYVP